MLTVARSGSRRSARRSSTRRTTRCSPTTTRSRPASQRVQLPPRGERRRRVRRAAHRRPPRLLVRLAGAVPRLRHPDRDLRAARAASCASRSAAAGSDTRRAPPRRSSTPRRRRRRSPRAGARCTRCRSLRRIWWSLPFLAVALVGFVVARVAVLRAGVRPRRARPRRRRRHRRAVPARRPRHRRAHRHAAIRRRRQGPHPLPRARSPLVAACCARLFALRPNIVVAVALNCVISASLAILGPGILAALSLAIPPRARATGFSVASLWVIPGLLVLPLIGWIADTWRSASACS